MLTVVGVTGGFVQPTPDEEHELSYVPSEVQSLTEQKITVKSSSKQNHSLMPEEPKSLSVTDAQSLLDELFGILKTIPQKNPDPEIFNEDYYGMGKSIFWGGDGPQPEWFNSVPQGCDGQRGSAKPEEKEKFERALAIIKELVSKAS